MVLSWVLRQIGRGEVLGGGKAMSRVLVEVTLCALRTLRHCDWRGYGIEMRKRSVVGQI